MTHALPLSKIPLAAKQQFALWVSRRYPGIYQAAVQASVPAGGLSGSFFSSSFLDTLIPNIEKLGKAYLGYRSEANVLNVQQQRLAHGLAPLSSAQLASMAPSLNVNTSIAPATAATLGTTVGSAIGKKVLLIGGLAIAAGLGLYLLSHRRHAG